MSDRPAVLRYLPTAAEAVVLVVLLAMPLYVGDFWLQLGLFVFAASIGAIGLNILTGSTGQLSLAHAFFLAVGAYGYSYFAGKSGEQVGGGVTVQGAGLPPLLAMVLAVALAGLAGLIFSPIASRLRGIYLGVASLALVFIGQHLLLNAKSLTGGFYGRSARPFSLFGFSFTSDHPPLTVLNVTYGQRERLWYLGLGLLVLAYLYARNVLRGRPGRALQTIRDSEVAASVMGVNVRRYKAAAFVVSSMYAGLAGVLVALAFQRPVPDYFDLGLSVTYLAMIVIGGLGSVRGAVFGAAFVTALPLVLTQYSDKIGFLAQPGQSGVGAAEFSKYVYGAAIVLVILVAPGGLSTLATGSTGLPGRRNRGTPQEPVPGSPRHSDDETSDKPHEEAKQV